MLTRFTFFCRWLTCPIGAYALTVSIALAGLVVAELGLTEVAITSLTVTGLVGVACCTDRASHIADIVREVTEAALTFGVVSAGLGVRLECVTLTIAQVGLAFLIVDARCPIDLFGAAGVAGITPTVEAICIKLAALAFVTLCHAGVLLAALALTGVGAHTGLAVRLWRFALPDVELTRKPRRATHILARRIAGLKLCALGGALVGWIAVQSLITRFIVACLAIAGIKGTTTDIGRLISFEASALLTGSVIETSRALVCGGLEQRLALHGAVEQINDRALVCSRAFKCTTRLADQCLFATIDDHDIRVDAVAGLCVVQGINLTDERRLRDLLTGVGALGIEVSIGLCAVAALFLFVAIDA